MNLEFARRQSNKLITCLFFLVFVCNNSANSQSFHIDTIKCGPIESDTSYLNKMIRHQAQLYNQAFGTRKNDTATLNISLYGNVKEYIRAVKSNKLRTDVNGVYSARLNRSFVYKNDIYLHVMLHAASDNLLLYNYPNAPRWLKEGLGSVLSFTDETGDQKIIYTPLFDYNAIIKRITWEEGIDFDSLWMDDNPDWSRKSGTTGTKLYALSYGIIYFLITRDRDYLTPIISSMKNGDTATEAISKSFGNFDNFKNQLTVYYRYAAKSKFQ